MKVDRESRKYNRRVSKDRERKTNSTYEPVNNKNYENEKDNIDKKIPFFKPDERDRIKNYNQFLLDLEKVLSYDCGKNVILTLIKACDIYSINTIHNNSQDAFKNGQRNIGLQLLHSVMDIDCGDTYNDMLSLYWRRYNYHDRG